jgi:dUTP pyrophosphatase
MMKVKFKKLITEATLPAYAKVGDAGLDMVATTRRYDELNHQLVHGTGIAVEIPEGHVGLLFPRSSVSKKLVTLANSVGVVDAGFRGEVLFKFNIRPGCLEKSAGYHPGNRVGQLVIVPYPQIEVVEAEELSRTERGTGGFGSSGA